jgi:hypothetical protein
MERSKGAFSIEGIESDDAGDSKFYCPRSTMSRAVDRWKPDTLRLPLDGKRGSNMPYPDGKTALFSFCLMVSLDTFASGYSGAVRVTGKVVTRYT